MRLLLVLLLAVPVASCIGQEPRETVFVATMGGDTVVVERARRTADSLTGTIAVRAPKSTVVQRIEYAAALGPQARVGGIDVAMEGPSGRTAVTHLRYATDSTGTAAVITQGDDATVLARVPVSPDAVAMISVSLALLEQVVRRARNIPGDSMTVPLFQLEGARAMQGAVRFAGDSVRVVTGGDTLVLRTDAAGRLLGGGDAARGLVITRAEAVPRGWIRQP